MSLSSIIWRRGGRTHARRRSEKKGHGAKGLFPLALVSCCWYPSNGVSCPHAPASQTDKKTSLTLPLTSRRKAYFFQGRSKPYLYSQLRMVSPHFFSPPCRACLRPAVQSIRVVSRSTRFPGLSASTWTSGGGITAGDTHTHTHSQRTRAHTRRENEQTIKVSYFSPF